MGLGFLGLARVGVRATSITALVLAWSTAQLLVILAVVLAIEGEATPDALMVAVAVSLLLQTVGAGLAHLVGDTRRSSSLGLSAGLVALSGGASVAILLIVAALDQPAFMTVAWSGSIAGILVASAAILGSFHFLRLGGDKDKIWAKFQELAGACLGR